MTAVIVEQPKVTAQIVVEDTTTRVVVTPKTTLQLVLAGTQGPAGPVGPPGPQGSVAGTDGQIQYNDGGGAFGGAADFYYDDTTNSVGIGTSTPAEKLNVIGNVEATEFIGNLRGPVLFKAQASETLAKGDAVYISGVSGQTPTVAKADSGDSAKMPSFGLVTEATNSGNPCEIVTFGTFSGYDTQTPGWSLGDTLYVNGAGQLQNTPPTGENNLIQNIGKVQRIGTGSGRIKVGGAGRTNATPNLDVGKIFAGNASNQAVSTDTAYIDIANSRVGIGTTSPTSKLHVYQNQIDTGSYPELVIHGDANTNMVRTQPKLTFRNSSGYGTYDAGAFSFDTLGRMQTFVYNTTENTPRIGTLLDGDSNLTLYHPYAASSGIFFNVAVFNGGDRYVKVNRQLATNHKGGNLRLVAGDAYTTSIDLDGGNLYAYGGLPNLNGAQGNVILGHDGTSAIGNVGIGTSTPPTKFTIQSDVQPAVSGTDFSLYGTTDYINYDRLHIYKAWWGPYVINSEAAGTATQQSLSIGSGNTTLGIDGVNGRFNFNSNISTRIEFLAQTGKTLTWYGDIRTTQNRDAFAFNSFGGTQTTAGTSTFFRINPAFNPSSGNANFINTLIAGTINQTGTASGSYTALKIDVTETSALGSNNKLIDAQVDGTSVFSIDTEGKLYINTNDGSGTGGALLLRNSVSDAQFHSRSPQIGNFAVGTQEYVSFSATGVSLRQDTALSWSVNNNPDPSNSDLYLYRDTAGTLAQRNSTNTQAFRIYNTYTDASNYERANLEWNSNTFEISTLSGGTGSNRNIKMIPSGSLYVSPRTGSGSSSGAIDIASGSTQDPSIYTRFSDSSSITDSIVISRTAYGGNAQVGSGLAIAFQNRQSGGLWARDKIVNKVYANDTGTNVVTSGYEFITHADENSSNTTTAMVIRGKNVGIGTDNPLLADGENSLHIKGTGAASITNYGSLILENPSGSGNNYAGNIAYVTQNNIIAEIKAKVVGSSTAGDLEFYTTDASFNRRKHLILDRDGKFFTRDLQVALPLNAPYSGDVPMLTLRGATTSPLCEAQMEFTLINNVGLPTTVALIRGYKSNNSGSLSGGLKFNTTLLGTNSESMILDENGDLGIGITAPTAKLTIADGTNPTAMHLYNTYTDASNYERASLSWNGNIFEIGTEASGTGTQRDINFINSNVKFIGAGTGPSYVEFEKISGGPSTSGGGLKFQSYYANGAAAYMAVRNDTDFQISQGSLSYLRLNSGGSAWTSVYKLKVDYIGYEFGPSLLLHDTTMGFFRAAQDTMGFTTAQAERMRITATGIVGIGTKTPTDKLTVDGDGRIQQYSGSATGDGVVSSLNLYSGRGTEASPTASVGVDAVSQPSESDINFVVQTQSGEATAAALKFVAGGTVTGNGTMSTTGTSSEIQVHVSATNGLVDRVWTFRNDGAIVAGDGTNSRFAITQTGFTNLAQDITIAQTYGLVYNHPTIGGSFIPGTTSNGTLVEAKGYQYYQIDSDNSTTGTARYSWRADGSTPTAGVELMSLNEDRTLTVTGTIEHRNSTTAQTYNIYNTYTDASNYERAALKWNSNVFEIGTEALGTGTQRNINFSSGNVGIGKDPYDRLEVYASANPKIILSDDTVFKVGITTDSTNAIIQALNGTYNVHRELVSFNMNQGTMTTYDHHIISSGTITTLQMGNNSHRIYSQPNDFSIVHTQSAFKAFRMLGNVLADTLVLESNGRVGIGTSAPTAKLDVNDDTVRVRNSKTPLSATDTGNQGDICWDANYVYVCIATNTWVRSALSTW